MREFVVSSLALQEIFLREEASKITLIYEKKGRGIREEINEGKIKLSLLLFLIDLPGNLSK